MRDIFRWDCSSKTKLGNLEQNKWSKEAGTHVLDKTMMKFVEFEQGSIVDFLLNVTKS